MVFNLAPNSYVLLIRNIWLSVRRINISITGVKRLIKKVGVLPRMDLERIPRAQDKFLNMNMMMIIIIIIITIIFSIEFV